MSKFRLSAASAAALCIALATFTTSATAALVLPPGHTWEYTFTDPTGDATWNTTTGLGGIWLSGAAPFSNVGTGDFAANTVWPADGSDGDDLWVRTALDLTTFDAASAAWDLGVDNGYKLFANGTLISSANAEGFTFRWEYSGTFAASPLVSGVNVIAVALEDHGGLTAFDMQISADPTITAMAEPGTLALLGLGLAGLAFARRRKAA